MSLILMRHAESQHNVAKQQVKLKHCNGPVKNTAQYLSIRINPLFHDQLITKQGAIDVQKASQQIDWENIGLILVSPMRRCLQTCKRMLDKANKKIEVKVQPLLKGRLSNIWGYGSSVQDLKISYNQYNFDNLNETPQIPWYIQTLTLQKQKIYQLYKNDQKLLYQNLKEQYEEFKNRVQRVKYIIDQNIQNLENGKKILIISHSCVLRTIVAEEFNKKNKGVSAIKFKNAKPIQFQRCDLFKWSQETNEIKKQNQFDLVFLKQFQTIA